MKLHYPALRLIPILIITLLLANGCGPKRKVALQSEIDAARRDTLQHPPEYQCPEIPRLFVEDAERAEFMAYHFWDNYDFSDTVYYKAFPLVTERAFVDFIGVLETVSVHAASAVILSNMVATQTHGDIFEFFCGLYEKYLYGSNSPVRNEELYIPVLKYIIESDKVGEADKLVLRHRLNMVLKNRTGYEANDFEYVLPDGKRRRMYDVKSTYTLLYFYTSGCPACDEIEQMIANSVPVIELMAVRKLKVLSVLVDCWQKEWHKSLSLLPEAWINGADADNSIINKNLYDLKALPSIYVLDYEKRVIAKDIVAERLDSLIVKLD